MTASAPQMALDAPSFGLPYGILSQKRPPDPPKDRGYDEAVWRELDDLYNGGYQMRENAARYLPRQIGETPERYQERLKLVGFIGYFGEIVDYYAAALFSRQLAVTPAGDADDPNTPGELPDEETYHAFASNADLKGCSFQEVMKATMTTAMAKGKALIAADFPALGDVELRSRADEERLGVGRPYAFDMGPEELIDWECDEVVRRRVEITKDAAVEFEFGTFAFAVLHRKVRHRASPEAQRGPAVEEFKIWRRGTPETGGRATWELYRTQPRADGDGAPQADDIVPLVDRGETSFLEIPLVEIRMPRNLWIGNVAGPLNLEHFQRRSALVSSQQKSLFEMPVVRLGPEIGGVGMEMPAERAQDPSRGDDPRRRFEAKGYMVLGAKDDLEFKGPSGTVYTIVDGQLDKLVDEIHRVTHRMAASLSSTSKALGRSGASKAADLEETVIVLKAYGIIAREAALRVYKVISDARGDDVHWTAHGLDSFEAYDRAALLAEGLQLDAISVPSRTWMVEMKTRFALAFVPGLSPDTQAQIRKEISDNIPDEAVAMPPMPRDPDAPAKKVGGAPSGEPARQGEDVDAGPVSSG